MDFAAALANLEKSAQRAARNTDDDRPRVRPPEHRESHPRRNQRPRYDNHNRGRGGYAGRGYPSRNPLDALADYGYRCLPPYRPLPLHSSSSDTKPKHIALLAISIDDLPYEHIWKEWAASSKSQHKVSLLCHAKFPLQVKSSWLRQRLLTEPPKMGRGNSFSDPIFHSHCPEWGSIQITRAMVDLLAAAMEIGRNSNSDREKDERFTRRRYMIEESLPAEVPMVDKFIFISETCLPVTTLDECIQSLFAATATERRLVGQTRNDDSNATVTRANPWEVSWVNARNRNTPGTPRNKYERDQFCDIHRMIPQSMRWKADQWIVLSRPHAAAVLDLDQHMRPHEQMWNLFKHVNASDEMYFPTALAVLQILAESESSREQVCLQPVTYTDWSEGMRNPATFSANDLRRIVKVARQGGCLLARKFSPTNSSGEHVGDISTDEWKKVLEEVTRESVDQKATGVTSDSEEQVVTVQTKLELSDVIGNDERN
ncbi:hypothetical protein FisN_6Hh147 [Fistulifera solaris]|uniref:Uncharacterized protein n=1 Tax=Fistulifera solaris TaxID=1519565 RepID=A0A1Z5JNE7_FISSO|nr:hypothetical protein FisN_6Hh147 [Fistulifera solaris]|eukprot:GAX15555.1 hypothetical protein FisN_6Hh147 [Fistulifera solaris]